MKKKILLLIVMVLVLLPINTKAIDISGYKKLNLDEALKEEGIGHDFANYKETKDQITIYLFRGKGCGYCRSFLNFLNNIIPEYGKYFKVVSFEVWYDKENSKLLSSTGAFMNTTVKGVPFIVIGDKYFPGYNSSYDEQIKTAIKDLYNKKDRYDVFKEMKTLIEVPTQKTETDGSGNGSGNNYSTSESKKEMPNALLLVFNLVFTAVSTIIICAVMVNENKKINNKIENLENKLRINGKGK